jgi:hypothetical protein
VTTEGTRRVCCNRLDFKRLTEQLSDLADPGSAEGVEFTLGLCRSCNQLLMSCWVGGGIAHCYQAVGPDFVEKLSAAGERKRREQLLADWWNAL